MSEQLSTPWRNVNQAAARAQVSRKVIYREVKARRLRAARVGGRKSSSFFSLWIDSWLKPRRRRRSRSSDGVFGSVAQRINQFVTHRRSTCSPARDAETATTSLET